MSPLVEMPGMTRPEVELMVDQKGYALKEFMTNSLNSIDKAQIQINNRIGKLAGDGEGDLGSIGRLESTLSTFIAEQRAENIAARDRDKATDEKIDGHGDRLDTLEQMGKDAKKSIDKVKRLSICAAVTKTWVHNITAVLSLLLLLSSLWFRYHPLPHPAIDQKLSSIQSEVATPRPIPDYQANVIIDRSAEKAAQQNAEAAAKQKAKDAAALASAERAAKDAAAKKHKKLGIF